MWLKRCCSDCMEKMNYNVQLKMSCISGKGFLHSGFWHLPKYKIQKPHEVLVQRGHHFPLTAGETEAGDKKLSVPMPRGIPSTALQDTSEKDKSTVRGTQVWVTCASSARIWESWFSWCLVTFAWLWVGASSCAASSEHNQRRVVFSPA